MELGKQDQQLYREGFVTYYLLIIKKSSKTILIKNQPIHHLITLQYYNAPAVCWYETVFVRFKRDEKRSTKEEYYWFYYNNQNWKSCQCGGVCVCCVTCSTIVKRWVNVTHKPEHEQRRCGQRTCQETFVSSEQGTSCHVKLSLQYAMSKYKTRCRFCLTLNVIRLNWS